MLHADFVHRVRLSEHASVNDSAGYRRRLAAFAALGYAWELACLLLPAFALAWLAAELVHGYLDAGLLLASAAAGAVAWCGVQALACRFDTAAGRRVQAPEAPGLFKRLERIRAGIDAPRLTAVVVDEELRAVITQHSRFSLFGLGHKRLAIGLPLFLALEPERLLALVAHEYGHLRRHEGRFAAAIYRARAYWRDLYECCIGARGIVAAATHPFLAWYSPRFVARSFALARQDEYEADRISARLLGADAAAAALTELALKEDWLRQQFWPDHWALAADHPQPVGPYRRMAQLLPRPLPDDFARRSLRRALRGISGFDDTHPVLRERLEGLGMELRLPAWSQRASLELLGNRADRLLAQFDHDWCRRNATAWKQHQSALGRIRIRVEQLQAQSRRSADEWVELGDMQRRLKHDTPVRYCYAQALLLAPHHGAALQGLYRCLPPDQLEQRRACLERLHESSAGHRWWSAQAALALLQEQGAHDPHAIELWGARLAEAEAAEARAWSELAQQPFLEHVAHHDLSDFERYELETELARWPDVRRAWLLRRALREYPQRRAYLLVLDLPGLRRRRALALCRALEPALWLRGSVLLLWAGQAPELGELPGKVRPLYDTRVLQ